MQRHSTSISAVIKTGAAVGFLACAATAHAQMGSSGYLEQLSFSGGSFNSQNIARSPHSAVTTYTTDVNNGTSGQSLVQFASDPAPWVLAKTSGQNSNPNSPVYGAAWGRMVYAFTLQGDANSDIPLSFYGSALIQAYSPSLTGATARFALGDSVVELSAYVGGRFDDFTKLGTNADVSRINRTGNIESGYFSGTALFHTDATGKASGTVDLTASASFNSAGMMSNLALAYIDPNLFFDPTWLSQHPNASLAITQGVGNAVSPVPEAPTSLALVSGLALLSLRRWRARQAARD
jgi:hypothetical protein